MEGYKYVIILYMHRHNITDLNSILEFSCVVAKEYNVKYDEISYTAKVNKKEKTKTLKYSQKNIEKLLATETKNVVTVTFAQYKDEINFIDPKFDLGIYISDQDDYPHQIIIIIDPIQMAKDLCNDDLIKLLGNVCMLDFKVEYGAAFVIETKKEPLFFSLGVKTRYLNEEEREMLTSLRLNIRQYKRKVWDIFWYNIIKKELIDKDMLDHILLVIPKVEIVDIGDKYLISLPLKYYEYLNNEKLAIYKQQLRHIFSEKDLIMYTR